MEEYYETWAKQAHIKAGSFFFNLLALVFIQAQRTKQQNQSCTYQEQDQFEKEQVLKSMPLYT